ncbi:MAG: HPF/RaiA family ribosome-associated protein [Arenicellales bacterium]|nr:HPF/RaiA family ribosome-associated protein [Arenicellales bacterium]
MQIPLQITYRNMQQSDAIDAKVKDKAKKLERFAEHITSCRVTIEAPHKHQRKGKTYAVKVDITLPGDEIVATRHPDQHKAHQDIYVAVRDAFDASRRQLEDYVRRRRHKVKTHTVEPQGVVTQVFPNADYGVIKTLDEREIYFHRNSVVNARFDKLEVGDSVSFNEEMGEKGPQASSVHLKSKHHTRNDN